MELNAQIIIEQFDNGISLKWKSSDDTIDSECVVATTPEEQSAVGNFIWKDIKIVMDGSLCSKVKMTIKYEPIKEEN